MTIEPFITGNPNPTEEEIREAIRGNICRCIGYTSIIKAIQQAADPTICCQSKP